MTTVCNGIGILTSCDYDYDVAYCQPFDDIEFTEILDIDGLLGVSSIQNDIAKIVDADQARWISISNPDDLSNDMDIKPEIRNGDCMWSAFSNNMANLINTNGDNTNSAASSYSESSAVPPAIVTGSTLLSKREPLDEHDDHDEHDDDEHDNNSSSSNNSSCNSSINSNSNSRHNKLSSSNSCRSTVRGAAAAAATRTATATISIPGRNLQQQQQQRCDSKMHIVEPYIPPGGSLLRKSNTQQRQQQQQQQQNQNLLQMRFNAVSGMCDFEMSEFRHNVDLRACVMGSNNISLTSCADANYIDHLSRELQNTSKERIDLPYRVENTQISDVLEVVLSDQHKQQQQQQQQQLQQQQQSSAAVSRLAASVDVSAAVASLSPPATTATSSDCDSDDGECSLGDSTTASLLDGNNSGGGLYMRHISDHSYTRCNEMETNLETPSDSDEEIDVVSLNDKKLPTNPSDRDRRVLQTKVANKISNGARDPQKSRIAKYDLPYTPASNSPVKSVVNSRYPSPSSTPYQRSDVAVAASASYSPDSLSQNSSSSSSCSSSECNSPAAMMAVDGMGKSRKRYYMNDCAATSLWSSGRVYSSTKGIKSSSSSSSNSSSSGNSNSGAISSSTISNGSSNSTSNIGSSSSSNNYNNGSSSSSSSALNRQLSLDEVDTIEKRNLHNDMERQRRIGLKNLFEALKKQIPNIRDKERAPKVNILREAAKLCEHLTSEDHSLMLKRQQLKAKLKQQQERLARLRQSTNAANAIE
ncbi:GH12538 [Drosophila grimshawi]|uniref:GH12538 n=1 Tax=Drosophila grimshawi TaxID=7222 RepID=B4JJS7_DROGR|nr:GH12538 [Drosophila grimshawi]